LKKIKIYKNKKITFNNNQKKNQKNKQAFLIIVTINNNLLKIRYLNNKNLKFTLNKITNLKMEQYTQVNL